MALSNLLNNQTITIDNHHRGGNILEWNKSLHIHKRMNGGCKSSVECEIYFADYNRGIVFSNERGKNVTAIKNEIKDAFYLPDIRTNFIKSFYDAVEPILRNSYNRKPSDVIRIVRKAVKRIAKIFDLPEDIQDAMIDAVPNVYMYSSDKYYIGLRDDKFKVVMGDNYQEIMHLLK